ncbi:hypothetical protein D3C77_804630 [compost metagenome]
MGSVNIRHKAPVMKTITNQVSQGYSHILKPNSCPLAINCFRIRNCETAMTRYTSSATAPEVARRNAKTFSGAK